MFDFFKKKIKEKNEKEKQNLNAVINAGKKAIIKASNNESLDFFKNKTVKKVTDSMANINTRPLSSKAKTPLGKIVGGITETPYTMITSPAKFYGSTLNATRDKSIFSKQGAKKVAGSALETGLDIAGGGVLGKAKAVSKAVPIKSLSQVIKTSAKTGAKIGAGYGAGYATAEGLKNNQKLSEILKNSVKQGAIGGLTGGALGGAIPASSALFRAKRHDIKYKPSSETIPAHTAKVNIAKKFPNAGLNQNSGYFFNKKVPAQTVERNNPQFKPTLNEVGKAMPRFGMTVEDVSKGTPTAPKLPFKAPRVETSTKTPKNLSTARKLFTSGERVLKESGEGGVKLVDIFEKERVERDLLAGRWKSLVKKHTSQLTPEQKTNLTDVLEGNAKPMDKTVGTSSKVMRNLLNKVQREAKGSGLDVGFRENYFPRKYNWDDLTKANRKESVLQHMVDTGQASTKAEADDFLNSFIAKNSERKSGNLEFERMFDIPGYEKDPEKALTMYADSASRRLSEVKFFGKKDENVSALINKIADEGGDYKTAQKIFDSVYKGEDRHKFADALLTYNTFTKLSLSFFSNLTQSVNTASKGGIINTVKGAGQALAQGVRAVKGTNYDDVDVLANSIDDFIALQETGLSSKFLKGTMFLFQKVENFNRRTASNVGVFKAKDLVKTLETDPASGYAIRQLKSLGLDVNDIVGGKLTEKQLLTAANKMAKTTQFKMNALEMPQAWRTPLGKVLTQFKGFSFMQTKFIRDEILGEAKQGNLAPLLRFIAIAPMASFVTQSARNVVNRVDPENEKTSPSFRKGDLYRKAIGDLPSDFVSQMQYATEKSKSEYTTPLQNLKNFTSPFTGPTGGDVMSVASALENAGKIKEQNRTWYKNPIDQKDPYLDMKRFGASKVPFVGRAIVNTKLAYPKNPTTEAKKEFITDEERKSMGASQEVTAKVKSESLGKVAKDFKASKVKERQTKLFNDKMNKMKNSERWKNSNAEEKEKIISEFSNLSKKHATAQMIKEKTAGMNDDQKKAYLKDLKNSGIMTMEVFKLYMQ